MADIKAYKKSHRPDMVNEEKRGAPHQGVYLPKHPEKVIGGDLIARSGWEMSFYRWCDDSASVVRWGSETVGIQYRNPAAVDFDACRQAHVDPNNPLNWPVHTYYPDVYVELADEETGDIKRILIEIKPYHQTERPVAPPPGAKLKEMKKFNEECRTYIQNVKKWEAAIDWCKMHDIEFKVFTERTLGQMGIL